MYLDYLEVKHIIKDAYVFNEINLTPSDNKGRISTYIIYLDKEYYVFNVEVRPYNDWIGDEYILYPIYPPSTIEIEKDMPFNERITDYKTISRKKAIEIANRDGLHNGGVNTLNDSNCSDLCYKGYKTIKFFLFTKGDEDYSLHLDFYPNGTILQDHQEYRDGRYWTRKITKPADMINWSKIQCTL